MYNNTVSAFPDNVHILYTSLSMTMEIDCTKKALQKYRITFIGLQNIINTSYFQYSLSVYFKHHKTSAVFVLQYYLRPIEL